VNVTNTHSSTLCNILTEENGVFTNLVALSVRLSVCLHVAIFLVAQIQSNHIRFCSEQSRNICLLQYETLNPISAYRYSGDFAVCLTETEE